jgi:hypothetical protein
VADESQALNIARNHATDKGRVVSFGFFSDGSVVAQVAEQTGDDWNPIGRATGRDALDAVDRAIADADSFVHARDNAKPKAANLTPLEADNPTDLERLSNHRVIVVLPAAVGENAPPNGAVADPGVGESTGSEQ